MKDKNVDCGQHGLRYPAFVCQHLNFETKVGFWEPNTSDSDDEDDSLNAWCDKCDEILLEEGEWNDRSEGFAQIQLVCDVCFYEMKKLNQGE